MNWTKPQKDAIESRGVSLMVSAAAGSGKTSVLTERILSLLSQENGVSSSRLVVVTFTKAAAKNLEDKLYRALSDLVAKDSRNTALAKQLMGLSRAQISTIHSFCFSLIREHRKTLGLTGPLRVGDPSRIEPLKKKAIEDALDLFLSEKDPALLSPREDLCRAFGSARSLAPLADSVRVFLDKAACLPDGIGAFWEAKEALARENALLRQGELSLSQSAFLRPFLRETEERILRGKESFAALTDPLSHTQAAGEKLLPFLEGRISLLDRCAEYVRGGDLLACGKTLEEVFGERFPTVRKCPPEEEEIRSGARDIYTRQKKELLAFARAELEKPAPALLEEMDQTLALTEAFLRLAQSAGDLFQREKIRRGLLDYGDLETFALALLAEKKDGSWQKTPLADRLAGDFDAVFVDEYQDTNAIQDLIFRCISRRDNLFLVGDPKQSIYRFRGAEPEIFARYKNTLPHYPAETGDMQSLFLSDNFRSSGVILDFVNRLFRVLMDQGEPGSLYQKEDELRPGKEDAAGEDVEIVLLEKDGEEKDFLTDAEQLLREENAEAAYIAGRISHLLASYQPEDVAVICRTNRQIALVRSALSALKIPCGSGGDDALSEDGEFLFVHSLLCALDNPGRDVPLLGALLSPVFRFSSDDLYRIRKEKKEGSFYSALVSLSKKEDETDDLAARCREALKTLSDLREMSKTASFPALIFHLYRTLSLRELFGKKDLAVMHFCLRCAEGSENAGDLSLSEFADYLLRCAQDGVESGEEESGVRLLTIHKSKGLEFPVVFVSFLAQPFDRRDEEAKLLVSPPLGVAFRLPGLGGRALVQTTFRKSCSILLREGRVEEEKRILYVALTRAEKKLILTAKPRSFSSLRRDLILAREEPLSPTLCRLLSRSAPSPLFLTLLPLRESMALRKVLWEGGESREEGLKFTVSHGFSPLSRAGRGPEAAPEDALSDPAPYLRDLSFSYVSDGLATLPEKLSVSQLLREGREEEAAFTPRRLLDFEKGVLRSGAAQIGTATHQVMQFADFALLEKDPEREFRRLGEKGFLSPEDLSLVEKDKIAAFFSSPLYQRMKASPRVVREKRFNVLLPAEKLLGRPGEVLVQGVVDAWFENPDGSLTLLDFKTDRVREKDGEEILIRRHGKQLRLYREAVEKMTGKKVKSLVLFSFSLGQEIPVPLSEEA